MLFRVPVCGNIVAMAFAPSLPITIRAQANMLQRRIPRQHLGKGLYTITLDITTFQ